MQGPIFRSEFRQVYSFAGVPPAHIRRALVQAGFTFNGEYWTRSISTTSQLSYAEVMRFCNSDMEQNNRLTLRDAGYIDYND